MTKMKVTPLVQPSIAIFMLTSLCSYYLPGFISTMDEH